MIIYLNYFIKIATSNSFKWACKFLVRIIRKIISEEFSNFNNMMTQPWQFKPLVSQKYTRIYPQTLVLFLLNNLKNVFKILKIPTYIASCTPFNVLLWISAP